MTCYIAKNAFLVWVILYIITFKLFVLCFLVSVNVFIATQTFRALLQWLQANIFLVFIYFFEDSAPTYVTEDVHICVRMCV